MTAEYVLVDNPDSPTSVRAIGVPHEYVQDTPDGKVRHPTRELLNKGRDIDIARLREIGFVQAVLDVPTYDVKTQRLDGPEFVIEGEQVVQRYTAVAKTLDERVEQIRRQRADKYANMHPHNKGNFKTQVGDTLDAIIKAFYGDKTELDDIKAKIDAIKAEEPMPT